MYLTPGYASEDQRDNATLMGRATSRMWRSSRRRLALSTRTSTASGGRKRDIAPSAAPRFVHALYGGRSARGCRDDRVRGR